MNYLPTPRTPALRPWCGCDDPAFRAPHILHDEQRAMAAMTEMQTWRIERIKARAERG